MGKIILCFNFISVFVLLLLYIISNFSLFFFQSTNIDDIFFLLKKKQTLSIIGITKHGKISTEKKKVLLQQLSLIS